MKPLNKWDTLPRGYVFKEKTFYSSKHLGLDIICNTGTPVYAPFSGKAVSNPFLEGGNVIDYYCNGLVMRFMHLSRIVKTGNCNGGDLIGYTGNTGTYTSGPHLHVDISKGSVQIYNINNFIDPQTFNWEGGQVIDERISEASINGWNETANEVMNYDGKHPNNVRFRLQQLEKANNSRVEEINSLKEIINSINNVLTNISSNEALQDEQTIKAIEDLQNKINTIPMASTITTDEREILGFFARLWKAILNK